jgi:hypothetical protein
MNDLRLGAQGIYTFNQVGGSFLPWVGLGLGWERAYRSVSSGGFLKDSETFSGLEAILQLGGDYKLADRFSIGPYVTCSIGGYMSGSATISGTDVPFGLSGTYRLSNDRALHSWFSLGVLGKWDI